MSDTKELDALIATIDNAVANASDGDSTVAGTGAAGGDALDDILDAPPRTTQVVSLKDSPVVAKFRQDLRNGAIRTDTANALFGLIRDLLGKLPLFGGGV